MQPVLSKAPTPGHLPNWPCNWHWPREISLSLFELKELTDYLKCVSTLYDYLLQAFSQHPWDLL